MMTALATVTDVHRRGKQYEIDLSCEQQTSCSSCSSQKSCGTGVVTKAIGNKSLSWHLRTDKSVKIGQVVE
ncbi:SoxR reducing system RseC family protein, partial [Escherichia coli]|nr:SoxR reducing system RseC family protein [Escherichia coli]